MAYLHSSQAAECILSMDAPTDLSYRTAAAHLSMGVLRVPPPAPPNPSPPPYPPPNPSPPPPPSPPACELGVRYSTRRQGASSFGAKVTVDHWMEGATVHLHLNRPSSLTSTDSHSAFLGTVPFGGSHLASFTLLGAVNGASFTFDGQGIAPPTPLFISCSHDPFPSPTPPPSPAPPHPPSPPPVSPPTACGLGATWIVSDETPAGFSARIELRTHQPGALLYFVFPGQHGNADAPKAVLGAELQRTGHTEWRLRLGEPRPAGVQLTFAGPPLYPRYVHYIISMYI